MGVRLKDIAKAAGVGTSTVSKVLNGYTDVSPGTREKVLSVAQTFGYKVRAAQHAISGTIGSVGLIINQSAEMFSTTPFVHSVLGGLRESASSLGVELRLYPFDISKDNASDFTKTIRGGDVDGVVLVKAQDPIPVEVIHTLQGQGIPLVVVGTTALDDELDLTCVAPNNMVAAHRVVRYLHSLGHSRIHFLADSSEHAGFIERYTGYCLAMRRLNLSPAPEETSVFGSRKDALASIESLLVSNERPTAVFTCNDELASEVLRLARRLQLEVPSDLSVVGFDDFGLAGCLDPPLTTNHLPCGEMANLALAEIQRLAAVDEPVAVRHHISCRLVIRSSVGPALHL